MKTLPPSILRMQSVIIIMGSEKEIFVVLLGPAVVVGPIVVVTVVPGVVASVVVMVVVVGAGVVPSPVVLGPPVVVLSGKCIRVALENRLTSPESGKNVNYSAFFRFRLCNIL